MADSKFPATAPERTVVKTWPSHTTRSWTMTSLQTIPTCSTTKQTRCLLTEMAPNRLQTHPRKLTHYRPSTMGTSQTKKTGEALVRPPFAKAPTPEHPVGSEKTHIKPTSHPTAEAEAEAGDLLPRLWPNQCPCGFPRTICTTIIHDSNSRRPRTSQSSHPATPKNGKRCRRC